MDDTERGSDADTGVEGNSAADAQTHDALARVPLFELVFEAVVSEDNRLNFTDGDEREISVNIGVITTCNGKPVAGTFLSGDKMWSDPAVRVEVRELIKQIKNSAWATMMNAMSSVTSDLTMLSFREQGEKDYPEERLQPLAERFLAEETAKRKRLWGMRPPGKPPKLTAEERAALPARFDELYTLATKIKEHHDEERARFAEGNRRGGYKDEKWLEAWLSHSKNIYPDVEEEFLARFAERDTYAATPSEIAYAWLAQEVGLGTEYLKKVVSKERGKGSTDGLNRTIKSGNNVRRKPKRKRT